MAARAHGLARARRGDRLRATRRLRYLWRIATDAENATDVEIDFTQVPEEGTRIDIEHAGWDRLGDFGRTWRDANVAGWTGVLPAYQSETRVSRQNLPGG